MLAVAARLAEELRSPIAPPVAGQKLTSASCWILLFRHSWPQCHFTSQKGAGEALWQRPCMHIDCFQYRREISLLSSPPPKTRPST